MRAMLKFIRSRVRVYKIAARALVAQAAPDRDEDLETWNRMRRSYVLGVRRTTLVVRCTLPLLALLDLVALALALTRGGGEWQAFLGATLLLVITCVWAFVLSRISRR